MSAETIYCVALAAVFFLAGVTVGFGWAQALYRKLLASYQGYCAEYRRMLDER
jgi:hypothetical protein